MLLDFIWGMGVACHLEGQSRVFCAPRSTWYEVRSQNPAICQGEFKELKSGCVLVFHISIKHVYKMPGSPKCLMNQGALKGLSLPAAAWVTGSGHPVCLGHVRDTCEPVYSTDVGCSPSRPSGAAGNQSILPGPLFQPGAGHWCSTDSWNEGAARWGAGSEISLPTSETGLCVTNVLTRVPHHIYPHGAYGMALPAAGEGWLRAKQSRRLLWGTDPSGGFPALLPSASARAIKTIPDTELLSFLKPKQDTHRKSLRKHAVKNLGLFWDRLKENVKIHWRHERKKLNRSRSRDVSLRKWQGTQEKIREIV